MQYMALETWVLPIELTIFLKQYLYCALLVFNRIADFLVDAVCSTNPQCGCDNQIFTCLIFFYVCALLANVNLCQYAILQEVLMETWGTHTCFVDETDAHNFYNSLQTYWSIMQTYSFYRLAASKKLLSNASYSSVRFAFYKTNYARISIQAHLEYSCCILQNLSSK